MQHARATIAIHFGRILYHDRVRGGLEDMDLSRALYEGATFQYVAYQTRIHGGVRSGRNVASAIFLRTSAKVIKYPDLVHVTEGLEFLRKAR